MKAATGVSGTAPSGSSTCSRVRVRVRVRARIRVRLTLTLTLALTRMLDLLQGGVRRLRVVGLPDARGQVDEAGLLRFGVRVGLGLG